MPTEAIRVFAIPQWGRLVLLALGYFAAAKASLVFAIPPGYATAIWPPSGIALAALLYWGPRAWPGVWIGAAITNYSVDLSMGAALGIASGNTLEGVCAAWLARRMTGSHTEFWQPEKVFQFAGVVAMTAAIAASVGVTSLLVTGAVGTEQFFGNWYTWWQGDFSGMLLFTPCLLAWTRSEAPVHGRGGVGELALFAFLLLAMLFALFVGGNERFDTGPLMILAIPFLVWAACRFSERAVTMTVLAANGWAIWCTAHGIGPFVSANLNQDLLTLQAFTCTGTLVTLVLWALLRRRADEMRYLQESHDMLGQNLWSRARGLREQLAESHEAMSLAGVGTWRWDGRSQDVEWSPELAALCGQKPGRMHGSFDTYYDLVHEGDRERVKSTLREAFAHHQSWDRTERVVRADGEVRMMRHVGRAMPPRPGADARMHGVLIDISDYRQPAPAAAPQSMAAVVPELGLGEALRAYCTQFELRSGISVEVLTSAEADRLDAATALALFRIAEEALQNILRHARARRVAVELECDSGLATLTVRDDGGGFVANWQAKGGGGIKRIRERASALRGRVWIESSPGNGATLRVTARG